MRPIPADSLGHAHGLLRAIDKRGRLRTDEFVTEFSVEDLFPPDLENALGRLRHFVSYARSAGLAKEDRGVVELTEIGRRYIRSGEADHPFEISPNQAEWLRRQLREKHMTDSIYHGLAIGLSLLASSPPGMRVSTLDFGRSMAYLGRAGWDNENTLEIQGERHLVLLQHMEMIDDEHRITRTGDLVRGELTLPVHMSLVDIAGQLNPGGPDAVRAAAAAEWAARQPEPEPEPVAYTASEREEDDDNGWHTVGGIAAVQSDPPVVPRPSDPPVPAGESAGPYAGVPTPAESPAPAAPPYSPQPPAESAGPPQAVPGGAAPSSSPQPPAESAVPPQAVPGGAAPSSSPQPESAAPPQVAPGGAAPSSSPQSPPAGAAPPQAAPGGAAPSSSPQPSAERAAPPQAAPGGAAPSSSPQPQPPAESAAPQQAAPGGAAPSYPPQPPAERAAPPQASPERAAAPRPAAAEAAPVYPPQEATVVTPISAPVAPAPAPRVEFFVDAAAIRAAGEGAGLRLSGGVYANVAGALAAGKHVILGGAPGSGKTTLALAIASAAAQAGKARGATVVTGAPDQPLLVEAAASGRWVIADEFNQDDPDASLQALSTLLGGVPVTLGGDEVKPAAAWRVIATWNGPPPRATVLRRFAVVTLTSPSALELEKLLRQQDSTVNDAIQKVLALGARVGAGVLLDAARHMAARQAAAPTDASTLADEAFAAYIAPLADAEP